MVATAVLSFAWTGTQDARPYVLEPPRLEKRTLTYFNDAPQHDWAVRQAVSAWNRTGGDVRLRPGPHDEAELVFAYMQEAVTLGGRTIQTDRSAFSGEHGRARPGDARIELPLLTSSDARDRRFEVALVVAHEIGHVLGLGHEDRTCATMNSSVVDGAPASCAPPPPGTWRCRLVEEDDASGVIELYGGRLERIRDSEFCPEARPPEAPVRLTAGLGDGASRVVLRGRVAPGAEGSTALVAQAEEGCPASPTGAAEPREVDVRSDGSFRAALPLHLGGPTCFAAWSQDRFDRLSAPATAWFTPPPPPPPPRGLTLYVSPGSSLGGFGGGLRWRNERESGVTAVTPAWSAGDCGTAPPRPGAGRRSLPAERGRQRYRDLRFFATPPASGCYTLWSRDRYGRYSEPVSVPVTGLGNHTGSSAGQALTPVPSVRGDG